MRDYMVTGGGGKLGSLLCGRLSAWTPPRAELDITDPLTVEDYLAAHPARAILHLAAISDTKRAEADTAESYRVNVQGTATMTEAARKRNMKLFYTSTDYVFPGATGAYTETDEPNPSNWYGFTKYAGELEIRSRLSKYLIIRTAFRPSVWPFASAYTDVYTSADYIDVIAEDIVSVLRLDISGVIHIGTPKKTLYELALRRNPAIIPELSPANFPKRKDLSIKRWQEIKRGHRL